MYQKSTGIDCSVHRYSPSGVNDTHKRFKPQRNTKRVTPIQHKKQADISYSHQKDTKIAKNIQRAIFKMMQNPSDSTDFPKQLLQKPSSPTTPDLSINSPSDSGSSIATTTTSSSLKNDSLESMGQKFADDDGYSLDSTDDEQDKLSRNKMQTCPNLSTVADKQFSERPLPPLPNQQQQQDEVDVDSSVSSIELCDKPSYMKRTTTTLKMNRVASKGQLQIKRAATWLGLASQKILTSPPVQNISQLLAQKYHNHHKSNTRLNLTHHYQDNFPTSSSSHVTTQTNEDDVVKKRLTCSNNEIHRTADFNQPITKVKQKNNSANKKITVSPKRIMYCRVMQIINSASSRDCEYELQIQLNGNTLATKRGILRKVEKHVSADRPYEDAIVFEVQEPFSLNFVVSARHNNTVIREGLSKMGIWPIQPKTQTSQHKLATVGNTSLNFENKMDILDQGISRFKLTHNNLTSRWFNIELLIDIKVEDIQPPVADRFPWAYATNQYSAASSYMDNNSSDECELSDPKEVLISQKYCQLGDYLTIYTRGLTQFTWKRYWVTLENNQLNLYDFTFQAKKEPLSVISLTPLLSVTKPCFDDCDAVGITRKTGLTLQFDKSQAFVTERARVNSGETVEGKAFVYADTELGAVHWRRTLGAYIVTEKDEEIPKNQGTGVDLRFLW